MVGSLEKGAFRCFWVLLPLCLFWWWIDSQKKLSKETLEERRAKWVLGWLVPLAGFWFVNPAPGFWRGLAALLALYRLFEIFVTGLGTALNQSDQTRARSLVTIGFYALQMTLIWAILYHSFTPMGFVQQNHPALVAKSPYDFAYISWTNLSSLGNNVYVPKGNFARILEASTIAAGIFLLGVLLAFGIDATKDGQTKGAKTPGAEPSPTRCPSEPQ